MQSYAQTARQKKSLEELLDWAATVEGTPLAVDAANAEIKRRELMAHFEIITLQREALNIQKQAAESQRDAAIETQRTAEYTKETVFYMKWSVIVLAIAFVANCLAGIAGLFIYR
jgi:hypothetical protein